MQPQVSTPCNTCWDALARTSTTELPDDPTLAIFRAGRNAGYDECLVDLADAIGGRINPPRPTALEILRWGPAGREHFGDARPGDLPGRARVQ
jgi:hypothetical protein